MHPASRVGVGVGTRSTRWTSTSGRGDLDLVPVVWARAGRARVCRVSTRAARVACAFSVHRGRCPCPCRVQCRVSRVSRTSDQRPASSSSSQQSKVKSQKSASCELRCIIILPNFIVIYQTAAHESLTIRSPLSISIHRVTRHLHLHLLYFLLGPALAAYVLWVLLLLPHHLRATSTLVARHTPRSPHSPRVNSSESSSHRRNAVKPLTASSELIPLEVGVLCPGNLSFLPRDDSIAIAIVLLFQVFLDSVQ